MNENHYRLYPVSNPFDGDYLQVGDIHKIRFARYGNPNGEPVFFLHGGPGCGSDDEDARWFDPSRFHIITHDQRGSGKSIPMGEIQENKPQLLVGDIECLRLHLKINEPFTIFAGSWGSTLALMYAERYPENIGRMILRGIFTCGWKDQDYFYSEQGAARFSPEAWGKLLDGVPPGGDRIQERLHRLIEESDFESKKKWCTLLAEYEYSFFNISREEFEKSVSNFNRIYSEMRINMFYQANRFFLDDDEILNNSDPIKDIPVMLINGKLDLITPPMMAWKLHNRLRNSRLILVEQAGHLATDPRIQRALLIATNS